ncbi:5-fold beta-flower protein [Dyadobacter jiangsuensis]
MKPIKKYLILLLLAVALPVLTLAQSNYKQPMNISKDGKITDAGGITVGSVSKDKIVKDHDGHKVAFIDADGSLVDAKTNKKIGKMAKDGKNYYNANGALHLTVKDNGETCDIYDASGKKVGNVHSSYKGMACVLHCFENGISTADKTEDVAANVYVCPMHPEVTGKKGDSCSKCHMKMIKK